MPIKSGGKELKRKSKTKSWKQLVKDLDKAFSLYVRLRAKDWKDNVTCITCGKIDHYKKMQAGHYNRRSDFNTRWDLRNIGVQCFHCNMKFGGCLAGNYPAYTKYLLENYGEKWLKKLIDDGRKIKKWTTQELESEIQKYKDLIKKI